MKAGCICRSTTRLTEFLKHSSLKIEVPKLFVFMPPLGSQEFFHGAPSPRETPNGSVYYVVRSK